MGKDRKRGRGEGTISYRKSEKRYEARYTVYVNGLPRRKVIYDKDWERARQKLAKAIAERDAGIIFDPESLIVSVYLSRWLDSVEGEIRPSSYRRYEQNIRLHLLPALGKRRIAKITAMDLEDLYRAKLKSGLSRRTVTYIHTTIHQALKEAVRLEILPRNVAAVAKPPRPKGSDIHPLTQLQVGDLLRAAAGSRVEALYVLAVSTGMRRSELLGLKWEDVNLQAATLQVRRGLTVTTGDGVRVDDPKRFASRRSIDLSARVVDALTAHRKSQLQEQVAVMGWEDLGFIFTSRHGGWIHPRSFWDHYWKPLRASAGLSDKVRFHDLRHTYATLALAGGVPVKVVSEVLGHKDIATTLRIYAHVIPGMGKEAAKLMDSIIF